MTEGWGGDGLGVAAEAAGPAVATQPEPAAQSQPEALVPNAGKFFIVFSPAGGTVPVQMYPNHQQAAGAAWQMAKKYPGQTFYIMRKSGNPAFVPEGGAA